MALSITKNIVAQPISYEYDNHQRLTKLITLTKTIIYQYDKLGNRISQHVLANFCEGSVYGSKTNTANATAYQWQIDSTGGGFSNLNNSLFYLGTNTDSLQIINPPTYFRGYQYRCMITTNSGTTYTNAYVLKPKTSWQGSVDTAWSNPANWECNKVPDEFVDVTIPSGKSRYPVISSNAQVYSLTANQGASIIITAGSVLDIKGN